MKDALLTPARAGRYLPQSGGYRAFIPAPLPPQPPVQLTGKLVTVLKYSPSWGLTLQATAHCG